MATVQEVIELRPLERSDAARLESLFARLSPDSRYFRYLTPVPVLPDWMLQRLAAVDHDAHEAIGVFVDGELVGVAHWFRAPDDPETADLSLEVADDHHRHGHGALLLEELGRRARLSGIRRLTGVASSENRAIRALLRSGPWPLQVRFDGPEVWVELALTA